MARPRVFDEETALDAAMECFWEAGYEGTSTRDLTERMKVTPSSLYNAFGDKRTLFLRALDHYLDRSLRERIRRVESTVSPAEAIAVFLNGSVERSLSDTRHRGCFLVNSALDATARDPDIRDVVAREITAMEEFFLRTLTAARKEGTVASDLDVAESAKLLLSVVLGIRVLARVRPDRALLAGAAAHALKTLGLPPSPPQAPPAPSG